MASSPKARGTFAFIVLTTAIVWSLPRVGETQGGLAQQVANLEARVAALEAALDAEATARAAADTTLQNNINAIGTGFVTDDELVAEAVARAAADTGLQNNINAEAAKRQAADTTLQNNINNETAERRAADTTLQSNIDALALSQQLQDANTLAAANAYTDTSVGNEAVARQAADTTLQNNINSEALARQNADNQLQMNIDNEAAARQAADTTLQNNINAEAQARQNADNQLQNNIDAEAAARQAADTLLQNQIDALEACSCTPPPPVPQQLLDFANFLTIDRSTIKGLQGPHVIVTGANFHIRNGRDEPNPSMFNGESYTANGLGNLIVGYNGPTHEAESNRTGSHNVVIGDLHTYTGSGGFVAGFRNYLAEDGTSILGGVSNMLFGALSTVLGGEGWVTDQPLTILPPIQ